MQFSLSMPQLIPQFKPDWTLTDKSKQEMLKSLLTKGTKKVFYLDTVGLYLENSLANKEIYFIRNEEKLIYWLKLHKVKCSGIWNTTIPSQAEIWRDRFLSPSRVLVSLVFNWLYLKKKAILSDYTQSIDGFNFWTAEVSYSLEKGRKVYVVHGESYGPTNPEFVVEKCQRITKISEMTHYIKEHGGFYRFLILSKNTKLKELEGG